MPTESVNCVQCFRTVTQKLETFAWKNRIASSDMLVRNILLVQIDNHMPGLTRFVLTPSRWETEAAPLFPIDSAAVDRMSVALELVDAPLPFMATVISHSCPHCGQSHRIIHIGIAFYVFVSHLAAFLYEAASTKDLITLVTGLHAYRPQFSKFAPPPGSRCHQEMLACAMAWLLCHEIGHFAAGNVTGTTGFDGPLALRSKLDEEYRADFCALNMLIHRRVAHQLPVEAVFAGAGLLIRAWHVVMQRNYKASDLRSYGPRVGAYTPSPTLRWKLTNDVFDAHAKLGLLQRRRDFNAFETETFVDGDRKLKELSEEMNQHER